VQIGIKELGRGVVCLSERQQQSDKFDLNEQNLRHMRRWAQVGRWTQIISCNKLMSFCKQTIIHFKTTL
jgi:hypothetical protein